MINVTLLYYCNTIAILLHKNKKNISEFCHFFEKIVLTVLQCSCQQSNTTRKSSRGFSHTHIFLTEHSFKNF